ncbi:MAG: flagellar basal body-associated FliL family protein [Sedimentisphaerales bacterium]|nr:flagellar basal body-associated FliL family protein [Sedimentisphaerales bacterium]
MAGTDEVKEQKEKADGEAKRTSAIGRFLPWIILSLIVMISAAVGMRLGRLFAGSRTEVADPNAQPESSPVSLNMEELTAKDAEKAWYFDLDPVVANLNEPGVTRYVRATFTLEMSPEIDQKKGTEFLNEKKPIMINLLTVYLSSLELEDIRGDKNLRSIQTRVREVFNETLFPDVKPQIQNVLIKEFPVQ